MCIVPHRKKEDMIHFALRCPYFFNDWKNFWYRLRQIVLASSDRDAQTFLLFVKNLDNDSRISLLKECLKIPFNIDLCQKVEKFIAVSVRKIYRIRRTRIARLWATPGSKWNFQLLREHTLRKFSFIIVVVWFCWLRDTASSIATNLSFQWLSRLPCALSNCMVSGVIRLIKNVLLITTLYIFLNYYLFVYKRDVWNKLLTATLFLANFCRFSERDFQFMSL